MNGPVVTRSSTSAEFLFGASLDNIDMVCETIREALVDVCPPERVFAVQLVLREALNNAVLHGCKADPGKLVKCIAKWGTGSRLTVGVEDEGDGFDWREWFRNRPGECACSGRGLTIMHRYGEKVLFNDKGNAVIMEIDLSGRYEE